MPLLEARFHKCLLTEDCGNNGNTDIYILTVYFCSEMSVLWNTLFGDIQVGHDLYSGNDRLMHGGLQGNIVNYVAVDPHADKRVLSSNGSMCISEVPVL